MSIKIHGINELNNSGSSAQTDARTEGRTGWPSDESMGRLQVMLVDSAA